MVPTTLISYKATYVERLALSPRHINASICDKNWKDWYFFIKKEGLFSLVGSSEFRVCSVWAEQGVILFDRLLALRKLYLGARSLKTTRQINPRRPKRHDSAIKVSITNGLYPKEKDVEDESLDAVETSSARISQIMKPKPPRNLLLQSRQISSSQDPAALPNQTASKDSFEETMRLDAN
ncbi:hypothetical protein FNV43_RR12516 [Rhamnella rubrinervis]|uniref:Uncharacterized protein n=1 Tax=Rhamnella rubrinervis TaxID=2594499 RepID=A0A8K0H8G2_9ROSA|nr:hypothetical protein FNV43_RR12516 [Rhamnella rubrinervis]